MDVRCERCKTEYEFEDARISEAGVTVKCASCGHVFKVKKKAVLITLPVSPGGMEEPTNPDVPAPNATREWKLRQPSGNVFTFRELTTLQKWIVERKVGRDDEISLSGESWKRLGNIAELASFFQVVDEAQRASLHDARTSSGPFASAYPPAASPPVRPRWEPPADEAGRGPVSMGEAAVPTSEPSFSAKPFHAEPITDGELDLSSVRRGSAGKVLAVLAVFAALVGAGYFVFFRGQGDSHAVAEADAGPAELVEDAGVAGPGEEAKAAALAVVPGVIDAGVIDAGEAIARDIHGDAGARAPKTPSGTYDSFLALGDRLRERERPEPSLVVYGKAAELRPDRAEPVAGKALALFDLKRPAEAEAAFLEALKLNPKYGVALMGLAETYRSEGKEEEAAEYYRRYLDVLPNGTDANVAKSALEKLKE